MRVDYNHNNYTYVIIEDPRDKSFTGFVLELPEVTAGGFVKVDVIRDLDMNLKLVLDYRKKEEIIEQYTIQGYKVETYKAEMAI